MKGNLLSMEKVSYFLKSFPRLNTHVYVTQNVELKTRFHMNTSMHYHYHASHIYIHTRDFGGESNWVLAHAQGCGHFLPMARPPFETLDPLLQRPAGQGTLTLKFDRATWHFL